MSMSRKLRRKKEREQTRMKTKLQKTREQKNSLPGLTKIEVHGYMYYECQKCGKRVKMFLERGLEDKNQDEEYPELHKPVPFVIMCNDCGGNMMHVDWQSDRYFEKPVLMPEGCSYFKNAKDSDCGVAVVV